ncbi:class I SAM-dependent methyltransferase, partial [Saprospiraceae bacterium]|nr:class I SAM-dependent methyltransferase [Saprospiraceae bacterium]
QLTVTAYLDLADRYHQDFKDELENKEFDRYLLDQISDSLDENAVILDAGCGPSAQVTKYLSEKGNRMVGADICPKCIEIASEYLPVADFVLTDMRSSSFSEESFDAIIAMHSIIHTPKNFSYQFFREFKNLLKPGGRLLIVVKKGKDEGIVTGDWWEKHEIYFSHFMEKELRNLAEEYDFQVDLLETRKPYEAEIDLDRIYLLCTKK